MEHVGGAPAAAASLAPEEAAAPRRRRRTPARGDTLCYVLGDPARPAASYCGVTTCVARRLRQHNGGLAGGARHTRGGAWEVRATVEGFGSRSQALSFEWWVKRRARGAAAAAAAPALGGLPPGAPAGDRRCARLLATAACVEAWWRHHPPRPAALVVRAWTPGADRVLRAAWAALGARAPADWVRLVHPAAAPAPATPAAGATGRPPTPPSAAGDRSPRTPG